MSNGVLTNKQPVNGPANRAGFDAQLKEQTILQQAAPTSGDDNLARENTGQESQRSLLNHHKRFPADSAQLNQPILIDLGRNHHITRSIHSQETGPGCSVLRNLNSVIVQPSTIPSTAKGCGCQSQQPRRQDSYRSAAPSSDTGNRLAELSCNKFPAGAQYQQRSEVAVRRHSASNRTSLKRPHAQIEQPSAPVAGVDSGLPLALVASSAQVGPTGPENPHNQANQSDCNELDETEDEAEFDYEKVLSNILNEKKLVSTQQTLSSFGHILDELSNRSPIPAIDNSKALLNNSDVIKFIQQIQQQQKFLI